MPTWQATDKNYITAEDLINGDFDFRELAKGNLLPDIAYKPILIYVVRMPMEIGGGPVAAYWTRERAEKEARSIQEGAFFEREEQHRETACLTKLSAPRITKITLDGFCALWSNVNTKRG